MNDYTFGNFLCSLRTEKGLSQAQLGEMLGVTNKAVSKWENGSAKPNTKLLSRLAEILGVTVEELFASKRIEKNSELENIKAKLLYQKKKYAILTSAFLSALIIIPLLLIEFICVMMGFSLPDDVAGPIGAMLFIFGFTISLVSYVIYKSNFKNSIIVNENAYPQKTVKILENLLYFFIVALISVVSILTLLYYIITFSVSIFSANIFLSICALISILLLGGIISLISIKRLLKIKFHTGEKDKEEAEGRKTIFSKLSLAGKIFYISTLIFVAIAGIITVVSFFRDLPIVRLTIQFIGMIMCTICIFIARKNK